jgi:hypothetical protein
LSPRRSKSVAPCARRLRQGPCGLAAANTLQPGNLRDRSPSHRTAPCAVRQVRAPDGGGKRGVNDPGTGLRPSPRPSPAGVVHAPRVAVWGGACVALYRPGNLDHRAGRSDADSASQALCDSDGHHVRNRTRSTRRRTRFSAALRPRTFARGSRVSLSSWNGPGCRSARDLDGAAPERRNLAIT